MARKEYSPRQASRLLRSLPERLAASINKELAPAVLEAEAGLKQDVFRDGRSSGGARIGSYSTKPMYASTNNPRQPYTKLRGRGAGKNSNRKTFANGKPRRSRYFPTGYKGLRQFLGRETSFVNLKVTGSLERSIVTGTTKDTATIRFSNDEGATIGRGHEQKYGKSIFAINAAHRALVYRRLEEAARREIER